MLSVASLESVATGRRPDSSSMLLQRGPEPLFPTLNRILTQVPGDAARRLSLASSGTRSRKESQEET